MSPEILIELSSLPLFPRTAREIIELIGLEKTAALISAWGGGSWPVPMRVGGGNTAGRVRYAQLCEVIGDGAAERIVRHWGGTDLDVPNLKEVIWSYHQDTIRDEFDVLTTARAYSGREAVFELALKYGVTSKAVQNALKRPANVRCEPAAQASLF